MDIDILRERICNSLLDADLDIDAIAQDLDEQGEFRSIDYASKANQVWHPIKHLENVQKMQIALNSEGNKHYNDPAIREKVTRAMRYWNEKKYFCDWNGWFNNIGIGYYIPDILLFGIEGFTKEDQDELLKNYKPTLLQYEKIKKRVYEREVDSIGANLLDQVLSTMKIAVLENDTEIMAWLKKIMENELRCFPPYKKPMFPYDAEGIKSDWSFLQHFQMIYFGGYGEVLCDDMTKYLNFTKGTEYALSERALNFYANFLLEGMQFATRNGYRDFSASGRGATRVDGLKGIAPSLENTVRALLEYDGLERRDDLLNLLKTRFEGEDKGAGGHRYFHEADYSVMNSERYAASVRHASDRNRIYEYLNDENYYGFYSGLGMTQFCVDGDEYFNMPPVFNWNCLPGTTVRQGYIPTMDQCKSYGLYGNTKYVNGVTNKEVGCSYIKLNQKGVKAKKAYFMFKDAVICLGSNISSVMPEVIVTNIDQTRIKGDVTVGAEENRVMKLGEFAYGEFKFVHHNKTAYFSSTPITVSANEVGGDWHLVQNQLKSRPVTENVLSMNIYHGKRPINDKYAYTCLMNVNLEEAEEYCDSPYINVIKNTGTVQAVYDERNLTLMAVFHSGAEVRLPGSTRVRASGKCLLILQNNGKNVIATVSTSDCAEREIKIGVDDDEVIINADRTSKTVII